MTLGRRQWMAAGAAGLAGIAGLASWRAWPEQGLWNPCLGPLPAGLAAHPLVREAWEGIDPAEAWDLHAHLLGVGDGPAPASAGVGRGGSPGGRLLAAAQRRFFLDAACSEEGHVDQGYLARLVALAEAFPPGRKLLLLALDHAHSAAGARDEAHTHVWTSDAACAAVARAWPGRFEWAASVHPHRPDAAAAIEAARAAGARALKWIPSAQGIDPASPRCDAAYRTLARLDLPLLVHCGEERAAPGDDELGNPLRLRRALEHGVRVVVAHCASMGQSRDLDRGSAGNRAESFALFRRLMDEPAWAGRLFGDLSAVPQLARARWLPAILERAGEGGEWAGRLLDGSDYPIPAIMPLYSPRALADQGLLDEAAVAPLTAIRRHHPLLFDLVQKRHLRWKGKRLARAVFENRRFLAG